MADGEAPSLELIADFVQTGAGTCIVQISAGCTCGADSTYHLVAHLNHDAWGDPAAAVVSLLGWITAIKGAGLLLIPVAGWKALLDAMHYPSHSGVYTILPTAAGAYLTYAGFIRQR